MSRWYRAYEGTVTDAKIAEAALVAEVSRSVSIAAWHCLLESAAAKNNCGSYDTSARRVAVILCEPPAKIEALFAAFNEIGLTADGAIASWRRRQFQSDGSNERVKRYRENRKAQGLQAQWQPSKELRQTIYDRDGNACGYCGSPDDLTIDHKIPEMHGGDHSPENLQTACRRCNAQKRDLTHDEYVARLAGNGGVTLQQRPHRQRAETDKEESSKEDSPSGDGLKVEHVFEAYQDMAREIGLPVPRDLTPERRQLIRGRIAQYPLADFLAAFAKCRGSPFLRGDRNGRTPLSIDWLMKKGNFQKTLEGNYDR